MSTIMEWGKGLLFWVLGLALGVIVGGIPLMEVGMQTDPFDKMSSYLIWFIGLSLSAMVISITRPERVWRWAIAVGLGFLVAIILDIIIGSHFFLFPFSIILHVGIGAPPAFAGAYLGKVVRQRYGS